MTGVQTCALPICRPCASFRRDVRSGNTTAGRAHWSEFSTARGDGRIWCSPEGRFPGSAVRRLGEGRWGDYACAGGTDSAHGSAYYNGGSVLPGSESWDRPDVTARATLLRGIGPQCVGSSGDRPSPDCSARKQRCSSECACGAGGRRPKEEAGGSGVRPRHPLRFGLLRRLPFPKAPFESAYSGVCGPSSLCEPSSLIFRLRASVKTQEGAPERRRG